MEKREMSNLNKHLLLFLAVLFVLLLVPTAFASNIDDVNLVEVNNQLAVEDVSISETNDVVVESVSQSAVDEGQGASDDSDVLEANYYENDSVTAANDAIYVDGFDGSGGSGTSGNPYHSLKNVLNSSDLSNQIYLLPGTYVRRHYCWLV